MKKLLFASITALSLLFAPALTANAQLNLGKLAQAGQALTSENGVSAGKALLGLYTQYKADGRFDIKNSGNISNLMILASNIKGLESLKNVAPFVSGLKSGSNNLVTDTNSSSVLSSLTSLSKLDLGSIGTAAAGAAATSALSKLGGSSAKTTASDDAGSQASSILTGLFGKIGK